MAKLLTGAFGSYPLWLWVHEQRSAELGASEFHSLGGLARQAILKGGNAH
jgi:hypothetical protein